MFRYWPRGGDAVPLVKKTMQFVKYYWVGVVALLLVGEVCHSQVILNRKSSVLTPGSREINVWMARMTSGLYRTVQTRIEWEVGVLRFYQASLYLNYDSRIRRADLDIAPHGHLSFSLANRFRLLDPKHHRVGMTLYIEPTWAEDYTRWEFKWIADRRWTRHMGIVNFTYEYTRFFYASVPKHEGIWNFGYIYFPIGQWGVGVEGAIVWERLLEERKPERIGIGLVCSGRLSGKHSIVVGAYPYYQLEDGRWERVDMQYRAIFGMDL